MSAKYDFVIIGGGTAGLVLASRLSEVADIHILVLEAGQDRSQDEQVKDPSQWFTFMGSSSDWKFGSTAQAHAGDRQMPLSQGRILGGSSAINGLVYTPPSKATIDAWAALGNPGWEWGKFEQSLNKSLTISSVDGSAKGTGPLQVWMPDVAENPWSKAWTSALSGLGFSPAEDDCSGPSVGTVINGDTVDSATGQRSYAATAYLEPARGRENLVVVTGANVRRVLFNKTDTEEPVATGVQYELGGEIKVALASREVILSAGTFNSPRILELSGVGASSRLKKLGVDVVVENPFVGENLQCHSMCAVSFESDETALRRLFVGDEGAASKSDQSSKYQGSGLNVAAYLPFPDTSTSTEASDLEALLTSCSTHTDKSDISAGISADTTVAKANKLFEALHADFAHSILRAKDGVSGYYVSSPVYVPISGPPSPGDETYFSIVLLLPHPLSRGSVHITSSSPSEQVLAIDPRFLSHPLDVEVLARHLRQMETIIASEPLARCVKQGGKRNPAATQHGSFKDLQTARDYVRSTSVGAHHYTGTCSMMAEKYGGVVDEELRVYGCRNLRVCDASVIPITPPANPQATVYAVAEHGASIIKASL